MPQLVQVTSTHDSLTANNATGHADGGFLEKVVDGLVDAVRRRSEI